MNRSLIAPLAVLLSLGACNVTDNNNGSATISLDENRIEAGAEALANGAEEAGDKAANALENAGPKIEQGAADIRERAGRVADKAENIDVDVDLNTADTPANAQ